MIVSTCVIRALDVEATKVSVKLDGFEVHSGRTVQTVGGQQIRKYLTIIRLG